MNSDYKVSNEEGKTITFSKICEEMLELLDNKTVNDSAITEDNIMKLFTGVVDYGFNNPTPIQAKTIIPIFKGQDVIAQSQSGTGKTGAFAIGCLSRIDPKKRYPQAIIMANTRELAQQINSVCKMLSKHIGLRTCLSIGEYMNVGKNISVARESHVIIGTPGRIENIIKEGAFNMKKIKVLVLDEADELLSENFIQTMKSIITRLPSSAQICIFSATLNDDELAITKRFMTGPYEVTLEKEDLSLDIIDQFKVVLDDERHKIYALNDLYTKIPISQSVIFTNTKKSAMYVHNKMVNDNHMVGLLHGEMSSDERIEVLLDFRKGKLRALVTTNVIARGIDVQDIGLIFNFDIPKDPNTYLHRIGRSGRYGKRGVAINLVSQAKPRNPKYKSDVENLNFISNHFKKEINDMPEPDTICSILRGAELAK